MISLGLSGRNLTVKALPGKEFSESRNKILSINGRIPIYKNGEFLWWEFDKEKLPKILETWGEKIHYSDSAKSFVEGIKFKSLPLKDLPRAEITVRPINPDKQYRDFQEFVIGLSHEKRGLLIFFDCGLGKTLTSLARCFNTGAEKILVVTPRQAIPEFRKELRDSFGKECLRYRGTPKQREKIRAEIPNHSIVLCNYQMLKCLLDHADTKFSHVIFDECHNMADSSTIAYTQAKRLKRQSGENFTALLCSATPFENNISHLWTYLNYVNPELAGAREDFLNRFRDPIAFKTITKERRDGSTFEFEIPIKFKTKNEKELKKLLDTCMVVVQADQYKTFEDCMEVVPVELTSKQRKFYDNAINQLLEAAENSDFWEGNPLQKTLIVSQAAEGLFHFDPDSRESGKLDWVIDDCKRRLEIPGSKSVYSSAFRKMIELLEEEFYGQCVVFHGDKSDNYRTCAKYAFSGCQNDVELAEYTALRQKVAYFKDIEPGSIGLYFRTYTLNSGAGENISVADYSVICSLDNKARSVKQNRDRVRRLNTKHEFVTTKYLIGEDTDEDGILALIFRKLKMQVDLLAGNGTMEAIRAQDVLNILRRNRKR